MLQKADGQKMSQIRLYDFDGKTYEPLFDRRRLNSQHRLVFNIMQDGAWRTLYDLSQKTNCPEQSVSARLRDFRKQRFGGHTVERRRVTGGVFQYRLVVKH